MDNEMFSGFANVALPKDANLIAEPAQVVVMVPGTRAKTAEGALANLKNVIVIVFLVFILALLMFVYYKVQGSGAKYEGQILPGIRTASEDVKPTLPFVTVPPRLSTALVKAEVPKPTAIVAKEKDFSIKAFQPEPLEDIIQITGDIPTWPEDETSDDIDKKITDTDESIIAKLKGREEFVKTLGEQVAAMSKTAS